MAEWNPAGDLEAAGAPARGRAWLRWAPVAVVLALLVAAYLAGLHRHLNIEFLTANRERITGFVAAHPVKAALAYLGVYIAAVSVSLPGASLLTVAGGFMFGWALGGALTAVAATTGACIIFLIARSSFGTALGERAGPRLAKLREGFQRNAFTYLLVLRLAPILPFWVVNIAPALFGMRLAPYALATFLGILPGTFAYSYFGEGIGEAIEHHDEKAMIAMKLGGAVAVIALVALLSLVVKRWRGRRAA